MEVIEMGEFRGQLILEINKGNCAAITDSAALLAIAPGAGGLYGSGTLINVLNGVDYSYAAVALDGFSAGSLWQTAPSPRPDLSDVNPKTSYILNQGFYGTTTVTSNWQGSANPADPVSAVLMRDTIINEFVLDSQTASGTDWVVTMPTKHYYVGLDPLVGGARSNSPAQRPFQRNFGAGGACDDWNIYTRGRDLSTLTPDGLPNAPLCWAANVISFNNSKVLASSNGYNFQTVHTNGSAILDFRRSILHTFSAPGGVVYSGLPAVGFMVQDFVNGTIRASDGGRVLSNYGGLFEHKYTSKSFLPSP